MQKKGQVIVGILIILIITTTLCFDNDDEKPPTNEAWWDLEMFNTFISQNFTVTEKEESGSGMIQKISEPENTLYIAVGIDREYTNLEAEALKNFVESGGNLIVASDNASNVNVLSKKFGITYLQHSVIYIFEEFDYNYTFLPVNARTFNNSFSILMHSPKGLELDISKNIETLAESKNEPNRVISALDRNNNGEIEATDKQGPYPLIVKTTEYQGIAIFISDATMFTNNLWHVDSKDEDFIGLAYQNEDFIVDLVSNMVPSGGEIIYDISTQKAGFGNFYTYPVD
jgi:hypothetical protein